MIMENYEEQKNMQNEVLEKIQCGELCMKPKSYFMWKVIALVAVTSAVLVVSIFLFSFIAFSVRASGQNSLLSFGVKGWQIFFLLFPWKFLLLDILLIGIFEWLLRQFRFGYKKPIAYVLIATVFITFVSGFFVDRETHFHDDFLEKSRRDELPVLGGFYRHGYAPAHRSDVCRCLVVAIDEGWLTVVDTDIDDEKTFRVFLPPQFEGQDIDVGDTVFVAGSMNEGNIEAFGLEEQNFFGPPIPMK